MSKNFAFAPYSPSRMETIICPEHFRSKYLLKKRVPQDNRGPLDKGLVIHRLFERIINTRIAGEPLNINHVDAWLDEILAEHPAAFEYLHDVLRPAAINFMTKSAADIPFYDQIQEAEMVFAINENGEECGYEDDDCFARAVIDLYCRSGDTATLIDHKSQLNVEPSDTRKMLMYAWLACRSDPSLRNVRLILHFCHPSLNFFHRPVTVNRADLLASYLVLGSDLKQELRAKVTQTYASEIKANNGEIPKEARFYMRSLAKERGRIVDVPMQWVLNGEDWSERRMRDAGLIKSDETVVMRDLEEGASIEEEIISEVKYIEGFREREGEWSTTPNSKCEYCPSYYDCPARIEISELKAKTGTATPQTVEEATEVMKELIVLENQVKDRKKALKEFLKSDFTKVPSVVVGDQQFTTRLYHNADFEHDRGAVLGFLREKNQDPLDYMKFNSKDLNKFIASLENPEDLKKVTAIAPIKTTTKTQIYKL